MEKGSLRSGNTFLFLSRYMPLSDLKPGHTHLFLYHGSAAFRAPDLREFLPYRRKRAQTFFPYPSINTIIYWSECVHYDHCGRIMAQYDNKDYYLEQGIDVLE
jgi:hypothetical protein